MGGYKTVLPRLEKPEPLGVRFVLRLNGLTAGSRVTGMSAVKDTVE